MGHRHHYSSYYYAAISDHLLYRQTIIVKEMKRVSISFPLEYVTSENRLAKCLVKMTFGASKQDSNSKMPGEIRLRVAEETGI